MALHDKLLKTRHVNKNMEKKEQSPCSTCLFCLDDGLYGVFNLDDGLYGVFNASLRPMLTLLKPDTTNEFRISLVFFYS